MKLNQVLKRKEKIKRSHSFWKAGNKKNARIKKFESCVSRQPHNNLHIFFELQKKMCEILCVLTHNDSSKNKIENGNAKHGFCFALLDCNSKNDSMFLESSFFWKLANEMRFVRAQACEQNTLC